MATIEMHLNAEPFKKVKGGKKTIEVRIYDRKRRAVNLGDTIIFIKRPENIERIEAKVIGLSVFKTFRELFANIDKLKVGHNADLSIEEQVKLQEEHYSKEEEKNGVIAIHIKLIR